MSPLLLDTNAAIWLSRDELKASTSEKLDEAARAGIATYVSPITAWEVGQLVARHGRFHRLQVRRDRHQLVAHGLLRGVFPVMIGAGRGLDNRTRRSVVE